MTADLILSTELIRDGEIVPVLSLSDADAGVRMLEQVFGFVVKRVLPQGGAFLALGDQQLRVVPSDVQTNGITAHHLALWVPDVSAAMDECLAKGGTLALSETPDGPCEIPEFWTHGVRFVFFDGPEGSLIEFCMHRPPGLRHGWGHSHIGVKCSDIAAMEAQVMATGCTPIRRYTLLRQTGTTQVSFLHFGRSTIELFSPPFRI